MENHLGLGKETTWATPAARTLWLEILSEAIRLEPNYASIETIRSAVVRAHALGSEVVRGPFRAIANYQDLPSLFWYLFGDSDVTGAGPYTHTIPQASSPALARAPFTVEVQRDEGGDGETHLYAGCQLTELGLTIAVDELCEVSGAVLGSAETLPAASSPSYPDLDLVLPTDVVVNWAPQE